MATKKLRVGVLAGGASAERQISLVSGMQIASHLPSDRYEVVMLDPLALMERCQAEVKARFGVDLVPEVELVGEWDA